MNPGVTSKIRIGKSLFGFMALLEREIARIETACRESNRRSTSLCRESNAREGSILLG
ncbi:hypothetical protein CIPAW_03G215400 [Carya illinoinensis]|uniref:Uncharacterized protein n=1 Tax=Carya illinoinensis TaxID=32201 RepID=A0A8T1R6P0_CARIL|nr:hypothetical protein CIPAW_03G215400 [Carya illinoinensis]